MRRLRRLLHVLNAKGRWHWITVLSLTGAGLWLGQRMHDAHAWSDLHYSIYHTFESVDWQKERPSNTVVVEVTDDDYWKGELASRSPIKRTYLKKLVEALDAANVRVIALDFQMRSPT